MSPGMEPALYHPDCGASDPERIVAECCAAGAPAVVTFRDGRPGLRAAFSGVRGQRIELAMTDGPPGPLGDGAVCHVSFLYRDQPMTFTARALAAERDGDRVLLRLAVPARITSEGARGAFRIPSGPGGAVVLEVCGDDGVAWPARLANVSLSGMYVRFEGERPTLLPDQVVELSLAANGDRARLAGVVRRVEEDGVAFFFSDAVGGDPGTSTVHRIVGALERDWHSRIRR